MSKWMQILSKQMSVHLMKMGKREVRLAENLKRLMGARRLSPGSLAKQVGMNKSTLHNYCEGVSPRNLRQIIEISVILGVSLDELIFGGEQEQTSLSFDGAVEGKYVVTIKRLNDLPPGKK